MTDRDRCGLRGPVKTVITESFEWDEKAGTVSEKTSRREELTFSPQGNLIENVSQFEGKLIQRSPNIYDEAWRLVEIKYDDQDRLIEQTHEVRLFGYEKTVSVYNEHGDLSKQQGYSTHQEMPVDEEGTVLAPPAAPERLESETEFSYRYDNRGNWTRKKTATLHQSKFRCEGVETRSITYR